MTKRVDCFVSSTKIWEGKCWNARNDILRFSYFLGVFLNFNKRSLWNCDRQFRTWECCLVCTKLNNLRLLCNFSFVAVMKWYKSNSVQWWDVDVSHYSGIFEMEITKPPKKHKFKTKIYPKKSCALCIGVGMVHFFVGSFFAKSWNSKWLKVLWGRLEICHTIQNRWKHWEHPLNKPRWFGSERLPLDSLFLYLKPSLTGQQRSGNNVALKNTVRQWLSS